MSKLGPKVVAPVLLRAQMALGMSQRQMGDLLGASRKTIGRWTGGGYPLIPTHAQLLAKALHPVDAELAAEVAAACHQTLESLGIVAPRPPTPAAPVVVAPSPSLTHLVDAVVMAAAEAFGALSPQLRPVLGAAFERAEAMGLSVGDVARGLRGEGGGKKGTARAEAK